MIAAERALGAGSISLLILLLMTIATVLLIRNMSGRIKRLPPEFPEQERKDDDPTSG